MKPDTSKHPDSSPIATPSRDLLETEKSVLKRIGGVFVPLFSTVVFFFAFTCAGDRIFGLHYPPSAVGRDLVLQVVLAYVMAAVFRRRWAFIVIQFVLMGLLFLGNSAKTAFHGVPVTPDDVMAVGDLFWVLKGWQQALMVAVPSGIALLAILNIRWRLAGTGIAVAALAVVLLPAGTASTAYRFLVNTYGNSVWDQRGNICARGATLHMLMEGLHYLQDTRPAPKASEVAAAFAGLGITPHKFAADRAKAPLRNVHMILLESFWDPKPLKAAKFSKNPIDPSFMRLWKEAGFSTGLSPVFGGYTANSEFEALCGFPVDDDAVKFEKKMRNDVPGLPRRLADLGYATLASHPNVAGFWNRVNAYRRMGFQTYWSINDFEKDDMNRIFLSDASLYRQVLQKIGPLLDNGTPVFNYVVTYTGHWDYPLNERRPPVIQSQSAVAEVAPFADTLYYKSRETVDFIETLRRRDPDAVIVVFGDHAPFLGNNFAGYVESKVLAKNKSEFTADMFRLAWTVPLLVINGRSGPVKTGTLPLYRLPALILNLLGITDTGILGYTVQPPGMTVRPLPGIQLVLDSRGRPTLCLPEGGNGDCEAVRNWIRCVSVLSDDLFNGRQFSRPTFSIPGTNPSAPERRTAF